MGWAPGDFWSRAPHEFVVALDAHQRAERRSTMLLAWHTAALTRTSQFPSLEKLLQPDAARDGRMTDDEKADFDRLDLEMERQMREQKGG